jgi:hypothetical protein
MEIHGQMFCSGNDHPMTAPADAEWLAGCNKYGNPTLTQFYERYGIQALIVRGRRIRLPGRCWDYEEAVDACSALVRHANDNRMPTHDHNEMIIMRLRGLPAQIDPGDIHGDPNR